MVALWLKSTFIEIFLNGAVEPRKTFKKTLILAFVAKTMRLPPNCTFWEILKPTVCLKWADRVQHKGVDGSV